MVELDHEIASAVESTNHSGPILTPPTSLNLRSSHNQQLSCDTIKEGVVAVSKETQSSKSRQKYALTNIQKAMGLSQNPAPLNQSHLKEEQLDLNKNDRNLVRSSWDWLEGKDNQKNPTIRRRTKSFLEYHREEEDVSQEYFWRVSAGSTLRDQPVAGDAHSDQEAEPGLKGACLPMPCTKAQTEVRFMLHNHNVFPVETGT
uniref:Uncharacterized protein n=1 Tax=Sinocyclocheilus grahami TaxID=75366 RepID=A0A672QGN1_SINGR